MDANKNEQVEMTPFVKQNHLQGEADRSRNWRRNLSLYFSQYCDSTSIHGIKYIGQRGRYLIEKLLWLVIVVSVFTVCYLLIAKTYRKWQTSPVIVTFATTEKSISEIPFPAVTICPETKFDPDVFNYTEILLKKVSNESISEFENDIFEALAMSCSSVNEFVDYIGVDTANKTIEDIVLMGLLVTMPSFDPHGLTTLQFLGKKLDIEDDFIMTFTSEGLCYTFNMLPYEEVLREVDDYITSYAKRDKKVRKWSLDQGYPSGDDLDSYPRRTFLSGIDGGLLMNGLFVNHTQLDFLCGFSLQGFKVALHHPCELPNMDKHFRLPLDEAVFVGIKPNMITVSEDLINYKPEDRKCYFGQEKYLSLYSHYTQENCLSECLANYTLLQCGCIAPYMPSSRLTETCGLGSIRCIQESKLKYMENELSGNGLCDCLPSCTSLSYDVETSQSRWDWRKSFEVLSRVGMGNFLSNEKESHFSRLNVYYKDLQFLSSERNELYGYVDFFSNVGGLLGLFIGLSVTSCIEILYFLTLRLACNVKKYGKRVWSGEPDLINTND